MYYIRLSFVPPKSASLNLISISSKKKSLSFECVSKFMLYTAFSFISNRIKIEAKKKYVSIIWWNTTASGYLTEIAKRVDKHF